MHLSPLGAGRAPSAITLRRLDRVRGVRGHLNLVGLREGPPGYCREPFKLNSLGELLLMFVRLAMRDLTLWA